MILIIWAVIVAVALVSILLIYLEHEWGYTLGGSTAVILALSYFISELFMRSPMVVMLPQGANSRFDAMAIIAVGLLVLALIVIAFLVGRRSAARKD